MVSETLRAKKLEVIKKTTFNVYCRAYSYYSCGEEEVYDGWMDRTGYITLNQTHHHVEAALEILKELDRDCKDHCTHYKEFLNSLDLAKKNPTDWLRTFVYNYSYYLKVTNDIIDKISSIDEIEENIKKADKELSKVAIKPHYVKDFKEVNKNFGLDAGEFLVANLGYIAIEGKKAIYNCSKEIGTTIKQRKKLHCCAENGILIDDDSAAARENHRSTCTCLNSMFSC